MLKNLSNFNSYKKSTKSSGSRRKIFIRLLVILIILSVLILLPIKIIYDGFKDVQVHAKSIASAYQQQNFGQIQEQTKKTNESFKKINASLNLLVWMKFIPFFGGYYSDVKSLASGATHDLDAIEMILIELKPFEKELGFLGIPLSGQERITQSLNVLSKAMPFLSQVEPDLKRARTEVENIDSGKYPDNFKGLNLRQIIQQARDFMVGAHIAVADARDILEITPAILGLNGSKNYLILFQNDKEIRPTGGFITAFASLNLKNGQVSTTTSDDIYRLDERLLATCQSKICPLSPPAPIVKYLPEVDGKPRSAWSMRDSNISPDIPTSAAQFEKMYKLLGAGFPFEGIIYIDSQVVEELIDVTGPVDIFGIPYSSKIDHRCNCPNVIFELENYAEIAAKGEQDRKAVLGVLMSQILAKLVDSDTEKIPQALEAIVRLANHKHIMFYMHDQKTQSSLSKLNWTGEIKNFTGDYLHINDSNFAGGKSNLYVEQKVVQDIKIKNNIVTKKITIEYKNPQPFGIWLNGINRDYVRFYVPKGSKLISGKGADEPFNTIEDLDKTVFETFLTVRPQNSRKIELEYEIPYSPKDKYEILIQKQPGAKDFEYEIKLNGSKKADFKLDQDKEFKFDF